MSIHHVKMTPAEVGAQAHVVSTTVTFKFRVKDKHSARLNAQARSVNVVWNYCNEIQQKAAQSCRRWLTWIDLEGLTAGSSKDLDLHSHTIQQVCVRYDRCRKRHRRPWLRWRGRKSLGWVPFNTGHVAFRDGVFVFRGERYEVWLHRQLPPGTKIGAGSFNQDARGRWYINVPVEVECSADTPKGAIGIDLGLKDLATTSNGGVIATPSFYRKSEAALATAQRARKTKRARAIHAKARNQRRDYLHQASARLAKENGLIVIGDVSPSQLAKTRMAKSIHDAGWADFKNMLSHKAIRHGGRCIEVSEAYTTQVCSCCGSMPDGRPRGIADLGIREWTCGDCGAVHHRDVNAARNILRLGLETLAEGANPSEGME